MSLKNDILLVGLPRSGTSWVGAVLGSSPSVEYLREPITQAWLEEGIGTPTVDPGADPVYADAVAEVLAASGSRRLIKEVNPYLIPYTLTHFPTVVAFLHRHPCAVALSYKERRWTRLDLKARFGLEETGDFWFDHGRFQALLLRSCVDAIRSGGHIVSYEALTGDPQAEFQQLAASLGIEWTEASRDYLSTTMANDQRDDPYGLTRDATATRDRWMEVLTTDQQRAVLRGYRMYRKRGLPNPTRKGFRASRGS
jgi:hypothetical protein